MRNDVGKFKTYLIFSNFFSENPLVYEIMRKNVVGSDRSHITILGGACALHGREVKLRTNIQNMKQLLLFQGNNSYAKAPQY